MNLTLNEARTDPFMQNNTLVDGITFSKSVTMLNRFSGTVDWTQVDSNPVRLLTDNNGVVHSLTQFGAGPYCDGGSSYPIRDSDNNPIDSPQLKFSRVANSVSGGASDSHTMWLLFQPSGGHPVPLRAVNWWWLGSASLIYGVWTKTSGSGSAGGDYETESYPKWNNYLNGTDWIP